MNNIAGPYKYEEKKSSYVRTKRYIRQSLTDEYVNWIYSYDGNEWFIASMHFNFEKGAYPLNIAKDKLDKKLIEEGYIFLDEERFKKFLLLK